MHRPVRLIPALAIVPVFAIQMIAIAQTTLVAPSTRPDPRELLKQSADAIKQFKTYQLESVIALDMRGGPFNEKLDLPSSISVRRPDKLRIESSSKAGAITIVGDGQHTWIYLSTVKKYIKRAAVESPEASVINSGVLPKNLPDLTRSIKSVKLTGEETIDVGGVKIPCWVVETVYDKIPLPEQEVLILEAVQTTWITKDHRLNLQSTFAAKINLPGVDEPVEMTQSTHTTRVKLNPDLPESLFAFTPPAGAKETDDWTLPGITKPELEGKPAPALKGKTLDGADVDLAALRGKIVLVDFWTTWCDPCRRELPLLQKLHGEYRDKDLVVLGVTVGEDQTVVSRFIKSAALTYPMLALDEAAEGTTQIIAALSLTSFPTVVLIDREGKIKSYQVGARGEAALRDDLAKLGIGPVL
jgi:thiol-disulfide isomerase/thioredoxin